MQTVYGILCSFRLASHGKVLTRPGEILLLILWLCVVPLWCSCHSHRKSLERIKKKYADTIVSMAFQSLIIYSQCIGFAHTLLSFYSLFPLTSCQNLKNWLLNQAEKFKRPKFCLITFHIMSHLWQTMLIYFFESKILLSVQNNGLGFLRHCLEIDKDR